MSAHNLAHDFRSHYPAQTSISTPNTTISLFLTAFKTKSTTPEIRAAIQPYGRVSSRGEKQRGAACDLRPALLIVVPAICLVEVLYEFLY